MNSRLRLCFKVAWLTASVVILVMGTNNCVATDYACLAAGETMVAWMFVVSFPAGILSILVALFFLGPDSPNSLPTYLTLWLTLTCGGYLQWFVLAPKLFAKKELTVLSLQQKETANEPELREIAAKEPAENHRAPVRRPKPFRPIAAFDRQGRTPLERALGSRL
jgi:hypothetical protein